MKWARGSRASMSTTFQRRCGDLLGRRCLARLLPSIYVEASKDKIGEGFFDAYKEMSKAEGSQGCGRRILRSSARRQNPRLALWEEHLNDPIVALEKALKCVENSCWKVLARVLCGGSVLRGWCWLPPKFVGKAGLRGRLAQTWIQWIVCVYVHGVEFATEVRGARRALSS